MLGNDSSKETSFKFEAQQFNRFIFSYSVLPFVLAVRVCV
jgi:hypothetical protein